MSAAPGPMPAALSVAGSDPTGGAGLQLDLQVFARHDVYGMAVPTALTVQTHKGVHRTLPVFPTVVGEQLALLLASMPPAAIKIGMLATDDVLLQVANALERVEVPRVVDPVLRASDGAYLLERRAWGNLLERLVAGCALVTPNLDEAEELCDSRDPETAAAALLDLGARAALVKGGHATGTARDYLRTATGGTWIEGERHPDVSPHGTGCALSSAIAARLARGEALEDAVRAAKAWVGSAIRDAAQGPGPGAFRLRWPAGSLA